MNRRNQRNKIIQKKDKEFEKNSYPTTIDNKEEESILSWAKGRVDKLLKDRDMMTPARSSETSSLKSRNFVGRVKSNYKYYHDLKSALFSQCSLDNDTPVVNWLQQRMRAKVALLISSLMGFKFDKIDEEDTDFVYSLNQICRRKLLYEQEFPTAVIDAIAQLSSFGTAHIGLFHTNTWGEPNGMQYFEALDPLGVLISFGAKRINGPTSWRAKTLIIIRMRPKGQIEREWGFEIDDPYSMFVDPTQVSIMHAVTGNVFTHDEDLLPEVTIYHDDETREPVTIPVPKKIPVTVQSTGENLLDDDGNIVYDDVIDPKTGEIVYEDIETDDLRMSYPNGRVIVICNNQILYDDNNFHDHALRNVVKMTNDWDSTNYWALSDIDIGESVQEAVTQCDRDIFRNNQMTVGVLGVNKRGLQNKENNFLTEEGLRVCNLNDTVSDIKGVLSMVQAQGFSQDIYLYRYKLVDELGYLVGSPNVAISKSFAAESGEKFEAQLDVAMQFHNPIEASIVIAMTQLAFMWFYNERQFNKKGSKIYPIERYFTKRREQFKYSGGMEQMQKEYPVEVTLYKLSPTGREEDLQEVVSLKEIVPDIPDDFILSLSNVPAIVEHARMLRENRIGLAQMIQVIEEAGFGDELRNLAEKAVKAKAGGNGGVPA